jgi:hypothetical protein
MKICFLISYIAMSAFFFSIDNIANMRYSIDASSSEELIDSFNQMNNGLQFAPRCVGKCFLQQAECDHTLQKATLNHVGEYLVFPSMWYHHGYYSITPRKTDIQAQLFAMYSSNPTKEQ